MVGAGVDAEAGAGSTASRWAPCHSAAAAAGGGGHGGGGGVDGEDGGVWEALGAS